MKFWTAFIVSLVVVLICFVLFYRAFFTPHEFTDKFGNECIAVRESVTCLNYR